MKKLFFLTLISMSSFSLYAQVTDTTQVDTTRLTSEDSKIKIKDDKAKMKEEDGKLKIKEGSHMHADAENKTKIKDDKAKMKDENDKVKIKDANGMSEDGESKTKIKEDKAKMKDEDGKVKIKDANGMSEDGKSKTKIKENKRKLKDADGKVKVKGEGAMSSDMNTNTSTNRTIVTGSHTNTTTVNVRTTTEVFPDKPATLPVVGGNVPAEVVSTLKNKYGASLYDIKQIKSTSGQLIYVVRLFDNAGMRSEYVGADGSVVVR